MVRKQYAGQIDWDLVYRRFHQADRLANDIRPLLATIDGRILFAGFPSVASDLSRSHNVHFVDNSSAVIKQALTRYPSIKSTEISNVQSVLSAQAFGCVVLSGRMSAFLLEPQALDLLAKSINSFPRKCIVMDFFDVDTLKHGVPFRFPGAGGGGIWSPSEVHRWGDLATQVNFNIRYEIDGEHTKFATTYAFFRRDAVVDWARRNFVGYRLSLLPALSPGDPSFAIALTNLA